jgi:hypothetical protein
MRHESLEFVSEAILVDRLLMDRSQFKKTSGLFETLGLDSVYSWLMNYVKTNMSGHPGQWLLSLFASGLLFKMNPFLGILASVADGFGFGVTALISKIASALKPSLEAGIPIDISEVNAIGKSAVESLAGPLGSEANDSFNDILKQAAILGGSGGLSGLLSKLSPSLGRWTIGGIVLFVIKTLLLGAGLLAGGNLIAGMFKGKDKPSATPTEPGQTTSELTEQPSKPQAPTAPKTTLKPSGRGEQIFLNNSANIWIVPLINGSVEDTLLAWAVDVYPQLSGKEMQLESMPGFDYTVNMLSQHYDSNNPKYLVVPEGYHSRKEVVDLFSKDAEQLVLGE